MLLSVRADIQYMLNIIEPNKLYQNAVATGFSVMPSLLRATNIIEAKRVPRNIEKTYAIPILRVWIYYYYSS